VLQEFAIRNEMMVRVRPERFPPGTLKKLHARRIGPCRVLKRFDSNAYELDIPCELGINKVFNIDDLTLYHTPMAYPTAIPYEQALTSRSSQPFLLQPPLPPPLRRPSTEEIRGILTEEIVFTVAGTY